jgi:hypothetical protein
MKYHGKIGYGETVESPPNSGIWIEHIVEKAKYGDVTRNTRTNSEGQHLNNDLTVGNSISIVADDYDNVNVGNIRYITYMGKRWTVINFTVERPRIVLMLGKVYNGPSPT